MMLKQRNDNKQTVEEIITNINHFINTYTCGSRKLIQ